MEYQNIEVAVNAYVDFVVNDFVEYMNRGPLQNNPVYANEQIVEFKNSVKVKYSSKYIKIVSGGSVTAFIVNVDNDKQFKRGDLLKAAGWSAPARNSARGNVLEGKYSGSWTGPAYLN